MASNIREKEVKTVVVVGAGAAGLQAANILLESEAFLRDAWKLSCWKREIGVGGRILVTENGILHSTVVFCEL